MNDYSNIYDVIPTIFSDKIHSETLFHYTSIAGFLLMMENIREKECNLFPGHMRYQNDMQEINEGVSFVKNNISILSNPETSKKISESLNTLDDNIYIACFSSEGDLLEQWKYYGSNCGLSIEFDFNQCEGFWRIGEKASSEKPIYSYNTIEDSLKNTFNSKNESKFDFGDESITKKHKNTKKTRGGVSLNPIKVLYNDNEKERMLQTIFEKKILENMKDMNLFDSSVNRNEYIEYAISTFIPVCKNHYFSHEKESRLLFFPLEKTKVFYREKNNRILPYLKCKIVNKSSDKYPITSITVGPGNNQNLIFNSVINIIEGEENQFFISEDEFNEALSNGNTYNSLSELKKKAKLGELCVYINSKKEKVLTYRSVTGIYIYKSPIPFRN